MTTRCKFRCTYVSKRLPWNGTEEFEYEAEFTAVMDGSPENKEFFKYTPSGSLKLSTYKEDTFQPGQFYYVDISLAAEPVLNERGVFIETLAAWIVVVGFSLKLLAALFIGQAVMREAKGPKDLSLPVIEASIRPCVWPACKQDLELARSTKKFNWG